METLLIALLLLAMILVFIIASVMDCTGIEMHRATTAQ